MRHSFLWILVALTTPGCGSTDTVDSSDVNDDALYGEYQVEFAALERQLLFYAQFRVGGKTGTTVRLTEPAKIAVNDAVMSVVDGDQASVNLSGTSYKYETAAADAGAAHAFTWTRNDGSTVANDVAMPQPISVMSPSAGATHRVGNDLVVDFATADVVDGANVRCELGRRLVAAAGDRMSSWGTLDFSLAAPGAAACTFAWGDLEPWFDQADELDTGTFAWAVWVRTKLVDTDVNGHPQEGGVKVAHYVSELRELTFTP